MTMFRVTNLFRCASLIQPSSQTVGSDWPEF